MALQKTDLVAAYAKIEIGNYEFNTKTIPPYNAGSKNIYYATGTQLL